MTSEPDGEERPPDDRPDVASPTGAPSEVVNPDAARPKPASPDVASPEAEASEDGPPEEASPEDERRLHPAWILTRTLGVVRGLVPAFIGLAVGLREWAVPAAAALVVGVVVLRVLEWRVTRYAVVDGSLRLRQGVLARRERVVPASRISALDTSRGLVQRLFGLVSLEIQTAGGGKAAELKLDALTAGEAERLRAALGHAAAREPDAVADAARAASAGAASAGPASAGEAPTATTPGRVPSAGGTFEDAQPTAASASAAASTFAVRPLAPPPPPVYAVTGRQLVIAALTGPQLGLVGVLVGSVFSQAGELLPEGFRDRIGDEVSGADGMTILVAGIVGLLLAAAVSVGATVLAFAEFTVVRDERRLRVRRGLVTERTGTIPLDRIHGVRIVEGLLRRPLGYATVQVEVAGYRGDDDLTRTLVPLIHRSELPELMARMLPEVPWPAVALERPPARARRRYWSVPLLVAAIPALYAVAGLPGAWKLVALLPLALGLALGDARWRGAGWALDDETLAVRTQLVARTTLLALARRVQRVDLRTQPLQRRADLAAFDVILATGRHGTVRHLDIATADALQRAVAARTSRTPPPPAVSREGSLSFAAPPE